MSDLKKTVQSEINPDIYWDVRSYGNNKTIEMVDKSGEMSFIPIRGRLHVIYLKEPFNPDYDVISPINNEEEVITSKIQNFNRKIQLTIDNDTANLYLKYIAELQKLSKIHHNELLEENKEGYGFVGSYNDRIAEVEKKIQQYESVNKDPEEYKSKINSYNILDKFCRNQFYLNIRNTKNDVVPLVYTGSQLNTNEDKFDSFYKGHFVECCVGIKIFKALKHNTNRMFTRNKLIMIRHTVSPDKRDNYLYFTKYKLPQVKMESFANLSDVGFEETIKTETEPVSQPVSQHVEQPQTQPMVQPQTQPMVQPQTQPMVQPQTQPMVQPQIQPQPQPQTQPMVQPQTQPMVQPQPQPQTQQMVQPMVQHIVQPQTQPMVQPMVQPQTPVPEDVQNNSNNNISL